MDLNKNLLIKILCPAVVAAMLFAYASCSPAILAPAPSGEETGARQETIADNGDNGGSAAQADKMSASDLMAGIARVSSQSKAADPAFEKAASEFALGLFKNSAAGKANPMVSPVSVMLALAMTANGASGETLTQMEKTLGGSLNLGELNGYLAGYISSLDSSEKAKFTAANSIWFRDGDGALTVSPAFLQANADYYGAGAFGAPFDDTTLKDINDWVKFNTGGLIDSILDKISDDAVMFLINATSFDAEWEKIYNEDAINDGSFFALGGEERTVPMMRSEEKLYLDDGLATGFIKPYSGGKYAFAALLPNEDVDIYNYIASLTGEGFADTIKNASSGIVSATLPKFESEFSVTLNDTLKAMGIEDAFAPDAADFSNIGGSPLGNLFISSVLHKTYIAVDGLGTKAGAATSVEISVTCAPAGNYYTVTLDRPFVYAIIDTATSLPLFIGAVTDIA